MDARFELEFACQEAWEEMRELAPGERRCERCSETVVDLSRMTKKRALAVVGQNEPPCVSYLVMGDEPLFRRESVVGTVRGGLMAAAAGLLAACSTPEPACDLAPEPMASEEVDEPLLDPRVSAGPLAPSVGAPAAAVPDVRVVSQNGGRPDTAIAGDANDVDGENPTSTPVVNHHSPPATTPIHRVRGRMPRHRTVPPVPPVPTNLIGSS